MIKFITLVVLALMMVTSVDAGILDKPNYKKNVKTKLKRDCVYKIQYFAYKLRQNPRDKYFYWQLKTWKRYCNHEYGIK